MTPPSTQGKKEISEAVIIAALSAACTQLITWGVEKAKAADQNRQAKKTDKQRLEELEKEVEALKAAQEERHEE